MNQHAAAPEFAMSFTHEAVLLERREGLDWRLLGQVRFAGREMTDTLNALRDESGDISGHPDTVLVIPDDQILYTTLTVPVGADTLAAVSQALEAATPYKANELAFDWCPSETGDIEILRVAAVARRTLEEAEDFARSQGFVPSGFVARPEDERFDGQPDFGLISDLAQETTRRPFSEPDLTRARVTAPEIDPPKVAPTPAELPELDTVPEDATAEQAAPSIAGTSPVNACPISRIIPHHHPAAARAANVRPPVEQPEVTPARSEPTEPAAAPVRESAVIRHGDPKHGDSKHGDPRIAAPRPMSPRAEAVHNRAAEARAKRAGQAQPDQQAQSALLSRLRGYSPGKLTSMMGGLLVALLLVMWVFGGKPTADIATQDTVPDVTEPAADQTEPPLDDDPVSDTGAGITTDAPVPPAPAATEQTPTAAPVADPIQSSTTETELTADLSDADMSNDATGPDQPLGADTSVVETAPETATVEAVAPETATPGTAVAEQPSPQSGASQETPAQDALTQALSEALTSTVEQAVQPTSTEPDTAAVSGPAANGDAVATTAANPAPRANTGPTSRLRSSARPRDAAPARANIPANSDRIPTVPVNPLPYEQRSQPEPPRVSGARPPSRPAASASPAPASQSPATQPSTLRAPETQPTATPASAPAASARPPSRPASLSRLEEGSISEDGARTYLTASEQAFIKQLMQDLRTAQAGQPGLSAGERDLIRLADVRPTRRPVSISRSSENAVRAAVAEAVATAQRPPPRRDTERAATPTASTAATQTTVRGSSRPPARPGSIASRRDSDPGPGNASLSSGAVEDAIAAAVASSNALPGAVALTALSTSALPPRRGERDDQTNRQAAAPTADDLRAAAKAQENEAALAEQRRIDAELQAQAEARARARAQADAQAEARARAQAEARARAQAQAEAQAAAARKQNYTPPEAENEPEVKTALPTGRGQGSAAQAATVKDGIQLSRTQIIGTIGAGKASRALVRLSNGKIITLRLGDKINGGTITDIGQSRITFVKGGRTQQLSVLSGK
ncbi:hypothetical protein PAF17_05855 [Paracoccus sp. Z330]|uniref:Translation initiation factor 2 n=1 Tax=Paracoccus onchidii TaxID=3017813 RepID=A0ABT4ZEA6_9RHOB|nr:hypothetical protein [Paracoccus onchidii]MDB6177030.1 hypothetical protein [Paracoccus onchidii]